MDEDDSDGFETLLCGRFLDGLRSSLRDGIKNTYIGWEVPRMKDLLVHARHNEKFLEEREKKNKQRKDKHMEDVQLTLLHQVSQLSRNGPQQQYQLQPRGPPQDQYDPQSDVCFHCGQHGHWSRECPQKQRGRNGEFFRGGNNHSGLHGRGPRGGFIPHGRGFQPWGGYQGGRGGYST